MQEKLIKCLNNSTSTNIINTAFSILAILNNYNGMNIVDLDYSSFHEWLINHDAIINGLHVRDCEYGSGVFAKTNIENDSLMARIPREIMLSTEFHQRSDLKLILSRDQMLKSMESLVLTIQLLQEDQDQESFYRPYLNVLPRLLPKLPISYNTTDLESLKGSHVQYEAAMQIILHAKEFLYIDSVLQHSNILKVLNWSDFVWARGIVMTRQNRIPVSNDKSCLALIPFFDMFNHKAGQITTFFNTGLKTSDTFSNHAISAGNQVFISYGNRSNTDLFLFSGFVDLENSHDVAKIWIDFSDKLSGCKRDVLERLKIPLKAHFEIRPDVWKTSQTIILYLLVVFSPETACADALTKLNSSTDLDPLQSFESHHYSKVVDWIKMRCQIIISALEKKCIESSQVTNLFQAEVKLYKRILKELEL